jgi:hypothetical protein
MPSRQPPCHAAVLAHTANARCACRRGARSLTQAHSANGAGGIDRSKLAKLGSRKDMGAARRGRRAGPKEEEPKKGGDGDKKAKVHRMVVDLAPGEGVG